MMLSSEEKLWLIAAAKRWRDTLSDVEMKEDVNRHIQRIAAALEKSEPLLELLLHCPRCLKQHVDEGHFATHPHKVHACQFCGLGFVASKQPSVGVQFFDGWKNDVPSPWTFKVDKDSKPVFSPPSGLPDYIKITHTGQRVRFDSEKVNDGFDLESIFTIAELKFTPDGVKVRLEGDGPREWYPLDYFVVVKP